MCLLCNRFPANHNRSYSICFGTPLMPQPLLFPCSVAFPGFYFQKPTYALLATQKYPSSNMARVWGVVTDVYYFSLVLSFSTCISYLHLAAFGSVISYINHLPSINCWGVFLGPRELRSIWYWISKMCQYRGNDIGQFRHKGQILYAGWMIFW